MENYLIYFADMFLNRYIPKERKNMEEYKSPKKMTENVEVEINTEGDSFLVAVYVIKDSRRAYEILLTVSESSRDIPLLPPPEVLEEIKEKFGERASLDVKETLEFFEKSFKDYFLSFSKKSLDNL
jgi:hypothetical protein